MPAFDILVRGAGAVGLASALALSRGGLRVALLAGPRPAGPDLRAYALNAASVTLLTRLKVWDALPEDARTAVHDMHIEGDAPGAALDFTAWAQGAEQLAWIVDAGELDDALRAAVRFSPHVTEVDDAVDAALQVLADGKDSPARARLGVRMQRHDYGHSAVAARLQSDQAHANLARQWFKSPDVLALLPLDRPVAQHGLGLVWSLPRERAQTLMAMSEAAFDAALMDATVGAAGDLRLVGGRAQWPLSLGRAQAVCGPAWVLVGDAAHVLHPLAGQGLNLGLADVAALAEVLHAREDWRGVDDARLLQRYARQREAPTRAMAQMTDGLFTLFANPAPWAKELRNRGMTLLNNLPPIKRLLTGVALGDKTVL